MKRRFLRSARSSQTWIFGYNPDRDEVTGGFRVCALPRFHEIEESLPRDSDTDRTHQLGEISEINTDLDEYLKHRSKVMHRGRNRRGKI